ncbi:hypothetical protein A9Q81_06160 [Gammaproteobacteria bacterium 42_54_T18]|nr:hypothetical protein A9Q81_06160 [Gammaproteobacteria bacterium 42_54_T18]
MGKIRSYLMRFQKQKWAALVRNLDSINRNYATKFRFCYVDAKKQKTANISISGFLKCSGRNGTSMGTGFIQ